jgi:hypothetical protein
VTRVEARQTPTFEVIPRWDYSLGADACRLALAYFGEPLPWQEYIVTVMLAYVRGRSGRKDKFATHIVALSVPRQNGKSWVIRAWCFFAMCILGYKIIYTCQNGDTADEMFRSLAAVFEDEDNADVHPLLDRVRRTNGQQGIYLTNGGCIRFTTRTDSLARGRSYDAIIYDEAQELTPSQQAASLPTISASEKRNTMAIYLGTPPVPSKDGGVFRAMHDAAHSDDPGKAAWMEWAVTEVGDKACVARWYETNPSLGLLIDETAVEGELSMSSDDFARERLDWWAPVAHAMAAIPRELWSMTAIGAGEAAAVDSRYRRKTAFAVKFSLDGASYCLAGAKLDAGGDVVFEAIETGSTSDGVRHLAEWLWQRRGRAAVAVVDGPNGSTTLCDYLAELKCPRGYVVRPHAADVANAAASLLDGLKAGTARHMAQNALDLSALNSVRRPIGGGGAWGFGTGGAYPSEPIEACSLAAWAVRTTKRNPARKQRML